MGPPEEVVGGRAVLEVVAIDGLAQNYARRIRRQSSLSEFAGSDQCRFVYYRKRTVEVFQDVPTAREKPWKFVVEVS
jgi:hypothetical protein